MTSLDILNARQCFPVQVSDVAVQQRLCSANVSKEGTEKEYFWEMERTSVKETNVFSILHTAGRTWLPQGATKISTKFTPNHYVVTLVLVSCMALYVLMCVVTATYCFTRVSINLQSFTNKLISIYCLLLML